MPERWRAASALALAMAGGGAALWFRSHPSPCPFGLRLLTVVPRPGLSPARTLAMLDLSAGDRVLEIGPGPGYYSIALARALRPAGRLDLLDVQPKMLGHLVRRLRRHGLSGFEATTGDAQQLPFGDHTFDKATLILTLGEVPDQVKALAEAARVLKPGGSLVVGETILDVHHVSSARLARQARDCGLRLDAHQRVTLGYLARLRAGTT